MTASKMEAPLISRHARDAYPPPPPPPWPSPVHLPSCDTHGPRAKLHKEMHKEPPTFIKVPDCSQSAARLFTFTADLFSFYLHLALKKKKNNAMMKLLEATCEATPSSCLYLFSVDGIHVYRCTAHPVSLVGSELRVTVCVCVCVCERVCVTVCLHVYQGIGRYGTIWGVSARAGESHARRFPRFSANGVQSGSLLAPQFPVPNHYELACFSFAAVCVCASVWRTRENTV